MTEALWVTGDSLTVTQQIPTGTIDLIVTSPPFLAPHSHPPTKAHR